MLVLSRKAMEQIQIGDNVTITILKVTGRGVQIGIEAPRHVKVLRSELTPHASLTDAQAHGMGDRKTTAVESQLEACCVY